MKQRQVIDDEVSSLANELEFNLTQFQDNVKTKGELLADVSDVSDSFIDNPTLELITGNPQSLSNSYLTQMSRFMDEIAPG